MVYKRYIKKGGKVYGPYSYSNHKEKGKVVTEYIGKESSVKEKKINSSSVISLSVIIFLVLFLSAIFFYLKPTISGFESKNFLTGMASSSFYFGDAENVELLVKTSDNVISKEDKKDWTSEMFKNERAGIGKQGYIIAAKPEGWVWGNLELDPKRYMIIKIPKSEFNESWFESEYNYSSPIYSPDGKTITSYEILSERKYKINLEGILSNKEFNDLKQIPYNDKALREPIIKNITSISNIIIYNDWENRGEDLKLHGSSGTFTICDGINNATTCNYTSLAAWENAEDGDIQATGPCIANITGIWSINDSTALALAGWTTNASAYVKIVVDSSARHGGVWNWSSYRLVINNSAAITISTINNLVIEGIQIYNLGYSGDNQGGILFRGSTGAAYINISHNLLQGKPETTSNYNDGMQAFGTTSGTRINAWNNIIYNYVGGASGGNGVANWDDTTIVSAYSNTISNCSFGLSNKGGPILAKNNLANTVGDCYSGTFIADSDYNACNGTDTTGTGTNNPVSVAYVFVDKINGDFHLSATDTAVINNGTDLSADANLSFSDDIDYGIRTGTWDIGADEYVSVPTYFGVPFSISQVESVALAPLNNSMFVVGWCDESLDDIIFKVYDTNGTNLTGDITVDNSVFECNFNQLSISPFNSTTFVIGYADNDVEDATFAIYDSTGNQIVAPVSVDTAISYDSVVSVSALNSTVFAIGWWDKVDFDISYAIYSSNGTLLAGPTDADDDVSTSSSVSVSAFNSSTFILSWFDATDGDISLEIIDSAGNNLTGIIDAVNVGANEFTVTTSTFNSSTFVIGWHDFTNDDITFKTFNSAGNNLTDNIDAADNVFTSYSASVSALNSTAFVIGWYDDVEFDKTFSVYTSNGTLLTGPIDSNTNIEDNIYWQAVASYSSATNIGICNQNLIHAFPVNISGADWISYYPNGSIWDGICTEAPVIDTVYPQFSNYYDNNASLLDSGLGLFNVTVENTNGTVWLEINNTNITATNYSSNVYNVSYNFSTAGTYAYRWHSWGNGTSNNYNKSDERSYTVNTSVVAGDTTAPNINFTNPTISNASTITVNSIFVNVSTTDASDHSAFIDFNRDLMAWWSFDSVLTNGTVYDNSSWGNHGTLGNHATNTTTTGIRGDALQFDGINDYISLPIRQSLNLTTKTISLWVKPTSYSTYNVFYIDTSNIFVGFLADGTIRVNWDNSTGGDKNILTSPATASPLDIWEFYTIVYNVSGMNVTVSLYKNATLLVSSSNSEGFLSAPIVRLGLNNFGSWRFNGTMDEVMIFNRTLSLQEIKSLYNASAYQYYNNFTNLTNANYNFTAYAIDSSGNVNKTETRIVTVNATLPDTTAPNINFTNPTPSNASTITVNSIFVNVSTTDASNHSAFIDFNRSLIGWWSMDSYNTTGVYDNSTYGRFGNFTGGISTTNNLAGIRGNAFQFDGIDDSLNIGTGTDFSNACNDGCTITAWIKPNAVGASQEIVSRSTTHDDGTSNRYFELKFLGNGRMQAYIYPNGVDDAIVCGTPSEFGYTIDSTRWYFVALRYNQSEILSLIDNNFGGTAACTAINQTAWSSSSYPTFIGAGGTGTTYPYNGSIDEVTFFNRPLSNQELLSLYNASSYQYYKNFTNLPDANYNFTAYAIDSSGNINKTETRIVTINTASADSIPPYFTTIPANASLNYLQALDVIFAGNDETAFGSYAVNDTRFTINSTGGLKNNTVLGVAVYVVNVSINDTSGNSNSTIYQVNVSQATGIVNGTINGTQGNFTAINGTANQNRFINATNQTGYGSGKIYVNGTLYNSGTMPLFNVTNLSAGFYNITFEYDGNTNYSADSEVWWVNITISDTTAPNINITYPLNNSDHTNTGVDINYTIGSDAQACWYSNDSYSVNTTLASCANLTTITWSQGYHNVTIWANDSSNNVNSSSVSFRIDSIGPVCTLVNRSPSNLTDNSTGILTVILNCTDSNGVNITQIDNHYAFFITRTVDAFILSAGIPNYWSNRYPNNSLGVVGNLTPPYKIWRALGRNEGYWYDSITTMNTSCEGINPCYNILNDTFSYAIEDGEYGHFTVTSENTANTSVIINYTHPSVDIAAFRQSVYLSYESMVKESKKNYTIRNNNYLLMKRFDAEAYRGIQNYTMNSFRNFAVTGAPSKTLRAFYCNSSYNPAGATQVVNSPNCALINALTSTEINNVIFTDKNSSYSKGTYGITNGKFAGIVATAEFYIEYESPETANGKSYELRYVNGTTNTDVKFNDTQVAWITTNGGTTWVQANFTPDVFTTSTRNANDEFDFGYYATDIYGNAGYNFSFIRDEITQTNHPITFPLVLEYNSSALLFDININGTHKGVMQIKIGVSTDPDSVGNVTHNLTLRNFDGSLNYTINTSFKSTDDSDIWINFNTSNVLDGKYRMNITAYSGDNDLDIKSRTTERNFTIDNTQPAISIIIPTNGTNSTNTGVDINYTVSDLTSSINACWYSNDSYSVNTTLASCTNLTTITWSQGYHNVTIWANDSANNVNSSSVSFRIDSLPPYFTTFADQTIADNQTLNYDINAVDDGVGVESFAINWTTNFSIVASTGVLSNSTSLSAGVYYINVSVNDTLGNLNSSVLKITVTSTADAIAPYFTTIPANASLNYNQALDVIFVGSDSNSFGSYAVNDTRFTINSTGSLKNNTILGVALYIINVSITDAVGNSNSTIYQVNVSRIASQVSLTFDKTSPQSYPNSITPTCSIITGQGTPTLTNGTSATPITLGVGNWTFNCSLADAQNYTGSSNTTLFNITQNNTYVLSLAITPSATVTYPTETTATGSGCPSELTCNLSLNTTGIVTNPHAITLGVGVYNYTYNTTGNTNYSVMTASSILTVSQNTSAVIYTYLNNSRANITINNNTAIWLNSTLFNVTGTIYLYKNGTLINSGSSPLSNLTDFNGTGLYNITSIFVGNVNYSRSSETFYVNVTPVLDTTFPQISIISPTNNTNSTNTGLDINYTASDETALDSCWYSNDSYSINTTLTNCSTNITTVIWSEGFHNVTVWANDTSNNINSSSVSFRIDTIPPYFTTFANQTLTEGQSLSYDINAVDDGVGVGSYSINWTTQFSIVASTGVLTNSSTLAIGEYYINVSVNDTLGNLNSSILLVNVTAVSDITNPLISIISPSNSTYSTTTISFNISSNENLSYCLFTINNWATNYTMTLNASLTGANYTNSTMGQGSYTARFWCNDTSNNVNDSEDVSFFIDSISPEINMTYPQNTSYNSNVSALNYTYTEINPSSCWYSLNSGANSTPVACGTNWTGLTSNEGSNTWIVYINDSAGNQNSSSITFFKDSLNSVISYGTGTLANGTTSKNNWIYVNVSVDEINEDTITFLLYNTSGEFNSTSYTDSTRTINWTGLSDGTYYYNVTVNDTLNNKNSTETRTIIINTTLEINLIAPINNSGDNDGNVSFVYQIDGSGTVSNCSLSFNNSVNQTNLTVTKAENMNFYLNNLPRGKYNWSVNCTLTNDSVIESQQKIFSVIVTTSFSGATTNLSNVNVTNISNLVLQVPTYGGINFSQNINLENGTDLSESVNLSFNRIEVNSSLLPELNKVARLSFYGLSFSNPRPLKDGAVCTTCTEVSYSGGTFIYDVTGFSVYSSGETPVTPVTTPAGGGGGGSTFIDQNNFTLSPKIYQRTIILNRIEFGEIEIQNERNTETTFSISVESVGNIISILNSTIRLNPGEVKKAKFRIDSPTSTGIYTGKIIVTAGATRREIPVIINVRTEKSLFDITLSIPKSDKTVNSGEDLKMQINLLQMGVKENMDVQLNYIIKDFNGKIYLTESETVAVYNQKSFTKEFNTKEFENGDYVIGVELIYPGGVAVASSQFAIRDKAERDYRNIVTASIISALIIISAIIFAVIKRYKRIRNYIKEKIKR